MINGRETLNIYVAITNLWANRIVLGLFVKKDKVFADEKSNEYSRLNKL